MADEIVSYEQRGAVGLITFDDGKANAFSHAILDALNAALDRAEGEAGAVVIAGRPGRFSAGFDLKVVTQGGAATADLLGKGASLALRCYEFPLPVVFACTGHAVAMGAILLFGGERRIGTAGDFKIGMNEVAIGMTLPRFAVDLARERLSKRHFAAATALAEMYDPAGAVDAGYLDEICAPEEVVDRAVSCAERFAGLNAAAHRETKRRIRSATIARIRTELEEDLAAIRGA